MKDKFNAKLAFYLSLLFWVPLLNIGISIISIIAAVRALKLIYADEKKYGGLFYAYAAIAISTTILITSILFYFIYLQRRLTPEVIANSTIF